jgi:hypothetical protein
MHPSRVMSLDLLEKDAKLRVSPDLRLFYQQDV